jgi:hypothetical protein
MTYAEWIAAHYPTQEAAYGQCDAATRAMAAAFPELTRVRGHYYCFVWGERTHWWLVAPDGTIVDPTAVQFPSVGRGVYEPWTEGADEPTGKCPNCGGYVYGGGTVCSDECARQYESYLMQDVGR